MKKENTPEFNKDLSVPTVFASIALFTFLPIVFWIIVSSGLCVWLKLSILASTVVVISISSFLTYAWGNTHNNLLNIHIDQHFVKLKYLDFWLRTKEASYFISSLKEIGFQNSVIIHRIVITDKNDDQKLFNVYINKQDWGLILREVIRLGYIINEDD